MEKMNYTLGRGELHFSKFRSAQSQVPLAERYIGNSPDLSYTMESETLDHYNSDRAVREKDASVILQTNRSGAFTTDHVSPDNLAMMFLGEAALLTTAESTVADETLGEAVVGYSFQLGTTDASPAGARNVSAVTLSGEAGTPEYTAGADYVVDPVLGRITVLEGGEISNGDILVAAYTIDASVRDRVVSGSNPVEGALRYIARNPEGKNLSYFIPWVKITPNGDFTIKGDEWQTLPFTIEILKKGALEAIYIDGVPYVDEA